MVAARRIILLRSRRTTWRIASRSPLPIGDSERPKASWCRNAVTIPASTSAASRSARAACN